MPDQSVRDNGGDPAPDAARSELPVPVLEMRGVSKRYGSTQALDDVSMALFPGEIHSLLGENGAGKSRFRARAGSS